MRIKITKEQRVEGDVIGEPYYEISGNLGTLTLSLQDMKDLRDELAKLKLD